MSFRSKPTKTCELGSPLSSSAKQVKSLYVILCLTLMEKCILINNCIYFFIWNTLKKIVCTYHFFMLIIAMVKNIITVENQTYLISNCRPKVGPEEDKAVRVSY